MIRRSLMVALLALAATASGALADGPPPRHQLPEPPPSDIRPREPQVIPPAALPPILGRKHHGHTHAPYGLPL